MSVQIFPFCACNRTSTNRPLTMALASAYRTSQGLMRYCFRLSERKVLEDGSKCSHMDLRKIEFNIFPQVSTCESNMPNLPSVD